MPTGLTNFNDRRTGMPVLPNFGGPPTGGATQDRANIDALLRGEFDPYEINMQSAENAIAGGVPGSGFAQAGRYKLLDSEKLARQRMGNEMLDPYLNREHQQKLQSQAEAARLQEIAAQGEEALRQLQASQSGRMAELSQQQKAQLEYLAQQGSQALEQLKLQQSGQKEITGMNIGGNLANTALGGLFSLAGKGGGGSGGPQTMPGQRGYTLGSIGTGTPGLGAGGLEWGSAPQGSSGGSFGLRGYTPNPVPGIYSGGGDRNVNLLINDILKKYGFNNLRF